MTDQQPPVEIAADVAQKLQQLGPDPDPRGPVQRATDELDHQPGPSFRATPMPPADDPERLDLDGPGLFPEPVRLAMVEWLAHHGIDAVDVCSPGLIERQPRRRRVTIEQYLRHADHGGRYADATGEDTAREIRTYDIAHDVEPFPTVALDYAAGIRAHRARQQSTIREISRQLLQLERVGGTAIVLRNADVRAVLDLGCGAQLRRESGDVQTCVRTRGHFPDPHRDIAGQTWQEL